MISMIDLMIAVIGYILVFGTGLLADNLFQSIIEDESVSSKLKYLCNVEGLCCVVMVCVLRFCLYFS